MINSKKSEMEQMLANFETEQLDQRLEFAASWYCIDVNVCDEDTGYCEIATLCV